MYTFNQSSFYSPPSTTCWKNAQSMQKRDNALSQKFTQVGNNPGKAKPSLDLLNHLSEQWLQKAGRGICNKPDRNLPTPNPPTVNNLEVSQALDSYLKAYYSSDAVIQDVDGDGTISAGDQLDYGAGEEALRYATIDQELANTFNQYNALTEPVAFNDPGAQSTIESSPALKSYLDTYYPNNAELHEVNGDGLISAGDRIIYQDDQGVSQRIVINEALADKLNELNLYTISNG